MILLRFPSYINTSTRYWRYELGNSQRRHPEHIQFFFIYLDLWSDEDSSTSAWRFFLNLPGQFTRKGKVRQLVDGLHVLEVGRITAQQFARLTQSVGSRKFTPELKQLLDVISEIKIKQITKCVGFSGYTHKNSTGNTHLYRVVILVWNLAHCCLELGLVIGGLQNSLFVHDIWLSFSPICTSTLYLVEEYPTHDRRLLHCVDHFSTNGKDTPFLRGKQVDSPLATHSLLFVQKYINYVQSNIVVWTTGRGRQGANKKISELVQLQSGRQTKHTYKSNTIQNHGVCVTQLYGICKFDVLLSSHLTVYVR